MPGSSWLFLVLPGAAWYFLALPGTSWCCLVLPGAAWLFLVLTKGLGLHAHRGEAAEHRFVIEVKF